MSATDELRRMLDERGVPYETNDDMGASETRWNGFTAYQLTPNAKLVMHPTPEQAIAATLGRQKVKKVRGMTYDEHGGEIYYLACSGCGDWADGDLDCIGEHDGPNFCHNCGGEFDGPLLCKWCGNLADMEYGDMCAECYWHEGEGNDER